MQLNKNSILGLILETGLFDPSDKKEGLNKTFLNLNYICREMLRRGFKVSENKYLRGLKQLGQNKDGVKPLVDRQYTEEEKTALSDIFQKIGLACLRISDKIKEL